MLLRALLRMLCQQQRFPVRLGAERLVFVSSSLHYDTLATASKWRHQADRGHCLVEPEKIVSLVLRGFLPAVWRVVNE